MTSELMKDWLLVKWYRRVGGVFLRKWGMLVLDAFKGYLTPDIKATVTGNSMNTALRVILGE
jgi:hypothetical protein